MDPWGGTKEVCSGLWRPKGRGGRPPRKEVRMGLLDDLLNQLGDAPAERTAAPRRTSAAAPDPAGGSGMGQVMMALLPVVLGMMTSRPQGQSAGAAPASGGGLGDILGQVLGGSSRGGGGLGDLLAQFQRSGFA